MPKPLNKFINVVGGVLALLGVWEVAASQSSDIKFFLSSPSSSLRFAFDHYPALRDAFLVTTAETLAGFVLAIGVSFFFMLICLYWPRLLKAILPIFVTSQILPIITLAPLFIVLFGMGLMSKIAMVTLMCFFPIFLNFSAGVTAVSPHIKELLYVYDTPRTFSIFAILIPLSLPQGFVGLKVGTTMAIMGAIVAEFMGARDGLGKNLYLAPKNSQPELMICSIVLIVAIGFIFFKSVATLEQSICKWHTSPTQIAS